MMRTEKDAAACWCPFARSPAFLPGAGGMASAAINRNMPEPNGPEHCIGLCIGSQCMAWRWGTPDPYSFEAEPSPGKLAGRRGYCGLAGSVDHG